MFVGLTNGMIVPSVNYWFAHITHGVCCREGAEENTPVNKRREINTSLLAFKFVSTDYASQQSIFGLILLSASLLELIGN